MSKNTLLSELINYVSYDGTGKVTVTTGLVVNNVSNGRIDVLPDYAQNYFVSYAPGAASQSKLVLISAGVSFRPGWGADIFMDLDASGNLGVGGAANGSYKFNVTGTGRFTGALTGTSATFSLASTSNSTNAGFFTINDGTTTLGSSFNTVHRNANDGNGRFSLSRWQVQNTSGLDQSAFIGAQAVTGASNYSPNLILGVSNGASSYTAYLTIASSGAATFSSSVTVAGTNDGAGTLYVSALSSTNAARLRNNDASYGTLDVLNSNASGVGIYAVANKHYFSGNIGINVTALGSWDTTIKAIEIGTTGNFYGGYNGGASVLYLGANAYYNSGWKYATSTSYKAQLLDAGGGNWHFQNAVAGTAGNAITWTSLMKIADTGNVSIGTSSPYSGAKLQVKTATNINLSIQTGTAETTGIKLNAFNDAADTNIPLELNGSVLVFKTSESPAMRIAANSDILINTNARVNTGGYSNAMSIKAGATNTWGLVEVRGSSTTTGGELHLGGDTAIYAALVGEYTSTNNGNLYIRTLRSGTLTPAMMVTSGGQVVCGSVANDGYGFQVYGASSFNGQIKLTQVTASSGYVNETKAVDSSSSTYFLNKDTGTANGSSYTYFNIGGVSNAPGTIVYITLRVSKGATGSAINTQAYVQINGQDMIGVTTANGTGALTIIKTFTAVYNSTNGWQIIGTVGTY